MGSWAPWMTTHLLKWETVRLDKRKGGLKFYANGGGGLQMKGMLLESNNKKKV